MTSGWDWVLVSPLVWGAAGAMIAGVADDEATPRRSRAIISAVIAVVALGALHLPATMAGFGAGAQAVALALGAALALGSAAGTVLLGRLGLSYPAAVLAGSLGVPLVIAPLFLSNGLLEATPPEHRAELARLIVSINPYLTLARALDLDPLKLPAMYARLCPIGRSYPFAYSAWTEYVTRAVTLASALWGMAWLAGRLCHRNRHRGEAR